MGIASIVSTQHGLSKAKRNNSSLDIYGSNERNRSQIRARLVQNIIYGQIRAAALSWSMSFAETGWLTRTKLVWDGAGPRTATICRERKSDSAPDCHHGREGLCPGTRQQRTGGVNASVIWVNRRETTGRAKPPQSSDVTRLLTWTVERCGRSLSPKSPSHRIHTVTHAHTFPATHATLASSDELQAVYWPPSAVSFFFCFPPLGSDARAGLVFMAAAAHLFLPAADRCSSNTCRVPREGQPLAFLHCRCAQELNNRRPRKTRYWTRRRHAKTRNFKRVLSELISNHIQLH